MKNDNPKSQWDHKQKNLWDFAREAQTFDDLDETDKETANSLDKSKDNRDTLAEFKVDRMFAVAVKVCNDMLDSPDPEIKMEAVKEVFKLRAVTLRANKKQKTEEKKIQAAYDGFTFASGN
jgi:hypothetical protein